MTDSGSGSDGFESSDRTVATLASQRTRVHPASSAADGGSSDDDQSVVAPQFQSILRRISVGGRGVGRSGPVAQEFKSFDMPVLFEEDEATPRAPPSPSRVEGKEVEESQGGGGGDWGEGAGGDGEEDAALMAAQADFERRQSAMARNIHDYGRTITLKEERLKELEVRNTIACCSALTHRGFSTVAAGDLSAPLMCLLWVLVAIDLRFSRQEAMESSLMDVPGSSGLHGFRDCCCFARVIAGEGG